MGLGLSGGSRGLSKFKKLVVGIVSSIKTTMTGNETSTTALLAAKAIYDWAVGKFIDLTKIVTTWTATTLNTNIPSEKLVKDSLDLKADITPATGATSALRALYIARGYDYHKNAYNCVYNVDGTYSMNGFTDITEAEMIKIYLYSLNLFQIDLSYILQYDKKIRTMYPLIISTTGYTCYRMAYNNTTLIVFNGTYYSAETPGVMILNGSQMFFGCSNLITVEYLRIDPITVASNLSLMFSGCVKLENVKLWGIKVDFSFAWSPLISLTSLQYLVTNRANGTTRITITVHATVWAKLNDAVGYPTWNALLVDAVNNQYIDFVSA